MKKLFTSEAVTEGHPDKLCDRISDAVLDAMLRKDPASRVACETFATTGLVVVGGEISTDCYVDIPKLVRETICEVFDMRPQAIIDQFMLRRPIYKATSAYGHFGNAMGIPALRFNAERPWERLDKIQDLQHAI